MVSDWRKSLALLSLLIAAGSGSEVAVAAAKTGTAKFNADEREIAAPSSSDLLVQNTPLCRRVSAREGLVVRDRPNPNSVRLGSVPFNGSVTLADSDAGLLGIPGPDGRFWVEITAPISGYVTKGFPNSESNLIRCTGGTVGGTPQPAPPAGNLCRQIEPRVAPRGIAIRADASRLSAYRGGVGAGARVMLVPNYRLVLDKSGENRNWVEIQSPVRGFISAGNLIMCR